LASRYSYRDDASCRAAGAIARARGHYTRDELIEVCGWKTPRSRPLVAANTGRRVVEVTQRAFAAVDERTRMKALVELRGVGVPTASALLHFAYPDESPIIDVRALESLGVERKASPGVGLWLAYATSCRELAAAHRVSIRTLDKALWQYSKGHASRRRRARPCR